MKGQSQGPLRPPGVIAHNFRALEMSRFLSQCPSPSLRRSFGTWHSGTPAQMALSLSLWPAGSFSPDWRSRALWAPLAKPSPTPQAKRDQESASHHSPLINPGAPSVRSAPPSPLVSAHPRCPGLSGSAAWITGLQFPPGIPFLPFWGNFYPLFTSSSAERTSTGVWLLCSPTAHGTHHDQQRAQGSSCL